MLKLFKIFKPKIDDSIKEDDVVAFYDLVHKFNDTQAKAVNILMDVWNVKTPITTTKWVDWRVNQMVNKLPNEKQGVTIFPHGYGLSMKTTEFSIDFDFGEEGQINGFDAGRLASFNNKINPESILTDNTFIQSIITHEVQKGNLLYSGYINYYLTEQNL